MRILSSYLLVAFSVTALLGADTPDPAAERSARLAAVRRFGYQLQKLNVNAASASAADLLVLDPEGDDKRLTSEQVARLKKKPDGKPRIVLAYLSIGEAENYRPYWKKEWAKTPPAWLGPENPDWPGDFKVRYWDPDWQAIVLGKASAPLDRIVADGYDGVYLDIVDAFEFWEEKGVKDTRPKMVEWVAKIAGHARNQRTDFLVVPQNGEALAKEKGYLDHVDALGREDLLFDGDKRQPKDDTEEAEADIARFKKAGKPAFLIEYCKQAKNREEVYRRAALAGHRALVTVRDLDRLIVGPEPGKP
jgi:cysteinyl-tRNA synthetase